MQFGIDENIAQNAEQYKTAKPKASAEEPHYPSQKKKTKKKEKTHLTISRIMVMYHQKMRSENEEKPRQH